MNRNWTELLESYKEILDKEGKSINTISCYCSDVKLFVQYSSINQPGDIDKETIQKYKLSSETTLSIKTISRKLRSIKRFCSYLVEAGELKGNPVLEITIPKSDKSSINVFNELEVYRILDTAKKNNLVYVAISLLLQTGMKISELVAIKHSDLDLENKPPLIKIGRRTVTLTDKIFYILKDYVTVNKPKKIADYLFITRNNDPIHIRNMRTYISRVIRKAGVDKTINDLRNTFIVRQLDAGNSIEFVGNVAGHSSKQATERYLKLVKNYKDKGLNRIVEV